MTRYFLFGTLLWPDLLSFVAGRGVDLAPVTLDGWSLDRSAAGDWPVLVPGGRASAH